MKTSEIFRIKLKADLKKKGKGAQSKLAKKTGVGIKHLNDFLGGRAPLSEKKRELIAEELGYSYINYLKETTSTQKTEKKIDPPELAQAIDDLRAIYESKDPMLIGAIKSNLVEFRRAADDRKAHDLKMKKMQQEIETLKEQMKEKNRPKPPPVGKRPKSRTPYTPLETMYDRRKIRDRRNKSKKA